MPDHQSEMPNTATLHSVRSEMFIVTESHPYFFAPLGARQIALETGPQVTIYFQSWTELPWRSCRRTFLLRWRHAKLIGFIVLRVKVNCFQIRSQALEHKRHPAG